MTDSGKPGKPKAGFPPFPPSLESPQKQRASHIPTASTTSPYLKERLSRAGLTAGPKTVISEGGPQQTAEVGQNHLPNAAPAAAAEVASPDRKLCPAKWEASSPTASTYFFTMSPTAAPESRVAAILPWRLVGRNTGHSVMPLFSSHSWNERTGHVAGFDPYGTPIFRPDRKSTRLNSSHLGI